MGDHPSPPQSFIDPKEVEPRGEEATSITDVSSTTSHTDAAAKTSASSSDQPKKKRKSWGQVLPVPTTNLPPRKRAKTAEEKQQRHYERVQRNRLAAHNSRMRKQDEMDRVVAENNRLKQDNQHQVDEIKRLEDELAYLRSVQSQTRGSSQPLISPLESSSPKFSGYADPSSPPSLTSASSNEASSPAELLEINSPLSPLTVDIELAKFFGEQGWMNGQDMSMNMNLFGANDMAIPQVPQQQPASTDMVTYDDFLNLDGLDESSIHTSPETNSNSTSWAIPAVTFDTFGTTDFNLFPQTQTGLTNPSF